MSTVHLTLAYMYNETYEYIHGTLGPLGSRFHAKFPQYDIIVFSKSLSRDEG
jgi:hypothetical protein